MPKKTKVIGFIIEELGSDFSRELIEGARKVISGRNDVRLIVIPGKYVGGTDRDPAVNAYKSVYNSIYELGTIFDIDGLIIHNGSMHGNSPGILQSAFFEKVRSIPKVFISSELEDQITVSYDNRSGIREAIDGIVNVNGLLNICMLGGREDNFEARNRKRIFIESLKENGIMFREKMFENTDMSVDTETEAGRLLDRNPDVEAIFCVNDATAVGLYKAMAKRHLVPGKDILVFGFDNTRLASEMSPSLASIGADSVTIGQRAVELLLTMTNGEPVRSELIPTRPYGRGSFRYTPYEYNIKDIITVDKGFIYRMFDDCFYRYGSGRGDRDAVDLRRLFYEFISRMMKAMNQRYLSIEEFGEIKRLIDIFFVEGAMDYTDIEKMLTSINLLQEGIVSAQRMRAINVNTYINRLFLHMKDRALAVLSDCNTRESKRHRESVEMLDEFMVKTVPVGNGDVLHNICSNFALLGMKNAALYLTEEPITYVQGPEQPYPDCTRLMCVMKNGELYILPQERRGCAMSEVPLRKELSSRCSSYATFPIFYGSNIYGFLISELDDEIYTRGEYIAMLLGRTLFLDRR